MKAAIAAMVTDAFTWRHFLRLVPGMCFDTSQLCYRLKSSVTFSFT